MLHEFGRICEPGLYWKVPGGPGFCWGSILKKQTVAVGVKTDTITRADVRNAINAGVLTIEEERYIRLRYGISEGPTATIVRRGQDNPTTRATLAMIEASMVPEQLTQVNQAVKSRIINRLRNQ